MSLGGLGAREKRGRGSLPLVPIFSFLLILVGLSLFGFELITYSSEEGGLQSDVEIASVQVGGLSESEAQGRIEEVYLEQPIVAEYQGSPILLDPSSIGFRVNVEAMLATARAQNDNRDNFWPGFLAHLQGEEADPITVPLEAELQNGQLRDALEDISNRYDSTPDGAAFDLTALTFRSGNTGAQLDIEASMELISTALYNPDPTARVIELPTTAVNAEEASMDDLRQAILDYMALKGFLHDGVTTVGSVFVMDLATGEEMGINADVAHSGVSTIKVGLLVNYFRYQVAAPDPDTAYLMASAIICSHNPGANFLVQMTGDGGNPMVDGLAKASETFLEVGALNSWITSPLWVGPEGSYPTIAPPPRDVQPNPQLNAQPDPFNQTTAEDMGTLLMMIYDCATRDGGLRAIYPSDVTQTECQQILEVLTGVRFSRFSELGAESGIEIAHKVGYGAETVGDVAIVYSPNTDYIFTMYIWEEDLDNDGLTELDKWSLIDDVSRIVYNYFNPSQPLLQTRPPDNPLGGAACVLPRTSEEINLNDIDQNRFDANGNPVSSACYDWPQCRPFDNWGAE